MNKILLIVNTANFTAQKMKFSINDFFIICAVPQNIFLSVEYVKIVSKRLNNSFFSILCKIEENWNTKFSHFVISNIWNELKESYG